MGTGPFPGGGESGRGVALNTHHHLAPRLKKEYSYTSTQFLGLRGLLQGDLYLYLYPPNAEVKNEWSYTPTALTWLHGNLILHKSEDSTGNEAKTEMTRDVGVITWLYLVPSYYPRGTIIALPVSHTTQARETLRSFGT